MKHNLIDILIEVALAMIMFGIGLSLTFRSFKNVFASPRAVITGLSGQMILLPILAFIIASFSSWSPELKVGLVILSVCPGGTTSNLITYLLKGKTALSISLTTLNSILAMITIPYIVNLGLEFFLGEGTKFHLPYIATISQIFLIIILPALLGVFINSMLPGLSRRMQASYPLRFPILKDYDIHINVVKVMTMVLLGMVFSVKLFANKQSGGVGLSIVDFKLILPLAILFNVLSLAIGYFLARIVNLKGSYPMTLGIEVGLQNTAFALLIAGTLLQNIEMQKPALIYALFSFWTTLAFGFLTRPSTGSSSPSSAGQ